MKGFDCNCKLSYDLAKKFKQDGYQFAIRYVGRLQQADFDLDAQEVKDILRAGLQMGIVQHCLNPGWTPTLELGRQYGTNAGKFAKECGYKGGCINYLDLEGIKSGTPKQQIIDFCNAWYDEVLKAGYVPGIYIGFDMFLSGEDLYKSLKFQHYWKSFSQVPDVAKRSYEMWQERQITANGILIDPDEVIEDKLGNTPVFMIPEKVLTHTIKVYSDGSCEIAKEDIS